MHKRIMTVSYLSSGRREAAPLIRLCGLWIREAGFECGDRIVVQVLFGKLVITNNKEGERNATMDSIRTSNAPTKPARLDPAHRSHMNRPGESFNV